MEKVLISFVSEQPKNGGSPKIKVRTNKNTTYKVEIIDKTNNLINIIHDVKPNKVVYGGRQWFFDRLIKVYRDNEVEPIHIEEFNPKNKVVFIKIDGRALGDNLAWVPYVEDFRVKWGCTVICSTFFNELFVELYPNILFVKPNTNIHNVYAQCYIGAEEENTKYSPINSKKSPLQKVSTSILGLNYVENRPKIDNLLKKTEKPLKKPYVCISEHASSKSKMWQEKGGWQTVVDYLNSKNYEVLVISKEPTELKNVIDLTGERSLIERSYYLYHSDFFMGCSSGLSWLAWSVNTHVFMISDCTPVWHEFSNNITRISANPELKMVDYGVTNHTKTTDVIDILNNYLSV